MHCINVIFKQQCCQDKLLIHQLQLNNLIHTRFALHLIVILSHRQKIQVTHIKGWNADAEHLRAHCLVVIPRAGHRVSTRVNVDRMVDLLCAGLLASVVVNWDQRRGKRLARMPRTLLGVNRGARKAHEIVNFRC